MSLQPPGAAPAAPPLFDPSLVPVLPPTAAQAQLRAVPPERLAAAALRTLFANPPIWTPELQAERAWVLRPPAPAAVLLAVVLYPQPSLILTQRTAHLSSHSGQVAFPGGRQDAGDASAVAAALREAHEEIGLAAYQVEVLGVLPTYTTGSAFEVTPVVGLVQPGFQPRPNPHEVDAVFEVPLAFLMNPANHQRHGLLWEGVWREWYSMPYANGEQQRFIWGATAGMLRNLYRLLSSE